jgi:hypothetical protein
MPNSIQWNKLAPVPLLQVGILLKGVGKAATNGYKHIPLEGVNKLNFSHQACAPIPAQQFDPIEYALQKQ